MKPYFIAIAATVFAVLGCLASLKGVWDFSSALWSAAFLFKLWESSIWRKKYEKVMLE